MHQCLGDFGGKGGIGYSVAQGGADHATGGEYPSLDRKCDFWWEEHKKLITVRPVMLYGAQMWGI